MMMKVCLYVYVCVQMYSFIYLSIHICSYPIDFISWEGNCDDDEGLYMCVYIYVYRKKLMMNVCICMSIYVCICMCTDVALFMFVNIFVLGR
jgi:hypothetical protein